jgi:hypothetical protein
MGEAFDVCDDGSPWAVYERVLDSFEPSVFVPPRFEGDRDNVTPYEILDEFEDARKGNCGGHFEGTAQYAHMGYGGLGPLRASPEEAIEAMQSASCPYGCGHNLGSGQSSARPVGYQMPYDVYAVEEPSDEVVLLWDSVAVSDGDLLGLVQNRSAALFARGVTVTLRGHSWVFPLTVQPGEVAPFVVGAGTVSALPERSEIEVSAALSPQPDLSRSYEFTPFHSMGVVEWDRHWLPDFLADPDNAMNFAPMDLPLGPGDLVREWQSPVKLVEPNSHPGVAGRVADHTIEDPLGYLTFLDGHLRVFAVHRLSPINYYTSPYEPLTGGLPIIHNGYRHYTFMLEFLWLADSQYDGKDVEFVVQVGGANPGP